MRVMNLGRRLTDQGRLRLSCDIALEERDGGFEDLYIEVPAADADGFDLSPEALVLALHVSAAQLGEERVLIESPLCADLARNLEQWSLLNRAWFGESAKPVRIESQRGLVDKPTGSIGQSCAFLSGGVDSFSMVHDNIRRYAPDDPRAFTHMLFVYGLDLGDPNKAGVPAAYQQAAESLSTVLAGRGRSLIRVYTNFRQVFSDWRVYERQQLGSMLSAIAHCFSGRFSSAGIALDLSVGEYVGNPYGSHPWANQYLSSSQLRVRSEMGHLRRLDKVRLLAEWPAAIAALRVCYELADIPEGQLNCCRCRKCNFTKLELLVAGVLEQAYSFPDKSIDMTEIRYTPMLYPGFWEELIDPLRQLERDDLADLIQHKVDTKHSLYSNSSAWRSFLDRARLKLHRYRHRARRESLLVSADRPTP